jgi:hypothetical protein
LDFGDIKAVTKKVCKDLNEHFICPTLSDAIDITVEGNQEERQQQNVKLVCEDGAMFLFPLVDCSMLPIVHATTEEIAIYLWGKILQGLDGALLRKRGIHTMEVTVAEAVGQEATFRYEIPVDVPSDFLLDVRDFIENGDIIPKPCFPTAKGAKPCDGSCKASKNIFSAQLEKLAESINQGSLQNRADTLTGKDLEDMMAKKN